MLVKAKLICPECGKTFYKEKKCINNQEAEDWKEYITNLDMLCPTCYIKEKEKENLRIAKGFKLPKLIGTEKQLAYAENLRAKYIAVNVRDFEKITATSEEDVAKQCQELGLETAVIVKVLFETDASTLIPYLKYN